jgi:hypothetical protein
VISVTFRKRKYKKLNFFSFVVHREDGRMMRLPKRLL